MTRPQTCSRCGQEVRYGRRDDVTGWLHRDPDADHMPLFGGPLWTPELQEKIESSLAEMAARGKSDKKKDAPEPEDEPDVWAEVPEPYVTAKPVTPDDFTANSGIRQIYNLATGQNKKAKVTGWEVVSLTLAIGPYVGARGQVLSISDSVKMVLGGPEVDNGRRVAVASWRDGAFDFAYIGILKGRTVTTQPANSNALKAWIKEIP
jgi:hypothetical protein